MAAATDQTVHTDLKVGHPPDIEVDCIHLKNGIYHLKDDTFQESRLLCQNRLPVKYGPKAPTPDRWLTFLHELLDDADIPTLQEYLGYRLIPSTKGQKMMLIVALARAARASPALGWCSSGSWGMPPATAASRKSRTTALPMQIWSILCFDKI